MRWQRIRTTLRAPLATKLNTRQHEARARGQMFAKTAYGRAILRAVDE